MSKHDRVLRKNPCLLLYCTFYYQSRHEKVIVLAVLLTSLVITVPNNTGSTAANFLLSLGSNIFQKAFVPLSQLDFHNAFAA